MDYAEDKLWDDTRYCRETMSDTLDVGNGGHALVVMIWFGLGMVGTGGRSGGSGLVCTGSYFSSMTKERGFGVFVYN